MPYVLYAPSTQLYHSHTLGVVEHGYSRLGCAPIVAPTGGGDGATPTASQKVRSRRGMLKLGTLLAPSRSLPSDRVGPILNSIRE